MDNSKRPLAWAIACVAGVVGVSGTVLGGPVQVNYTQPNMDRWLYPFNSNPEGRTEASIFASLELAGFDDRDAQFLLGFTTDAQVPPGQGSGSYVVKAAKVRVFISQGDRFVYDPSFDPVASSYPAGDPEYVPDADPGKPIELFGVGYRNGFGATATPSTTEFTQASPFGGTPVVPPAEGARNAFPALFDEQGAATDVSRQVRERFEAPPMAVGQAAGVTPGQMVPANTEFTFDLDVCDPATRAYLQRSLDLGRVNLVITSLHAASGPGSTEFPFFYTRANGVAQQLGLQAKLELVVVQGQRSDFDNSGQLNVNDFIAYMNGYAAASPGADVDDNCALNVNDFITFMNLYAAGR
jgi:hypothetical protein